MGISVLDQVGTQVVAFAKAWHLYYSAPPTQAQKEKLASSANINAMIQKKFGPTVTAKGTLSVGAPIPVVPYDYWDYLSEEVKAYCLRGKEHNSFAGQALQTVGGLVPGVVLGLATAGIASGIGASISSGTGLSSEVGSQLASSGLKLASGGNLVLADFVPYAPEGAGGLFDAVVGFDKIAGQVGQIAQVFNGSPPAAAQGVMPATAPELESSGSGLALVLGALVALVLLAEA